MAKYRHGTEELGFDAPATPSVPIRRASCVREVASFAKSFGAWICSGVCICLAPQKSHDKALYKPNRPRRVSDDDDRDFVRSFFTVDRRQRVPPRAGGVKSALQFGLLQPIPTHKHLISGR
jgi:hypothetical protein